MNTDSDINMDQLLELYDRGELAILFDWLQVPRPPQLKELEHEWQTSFEDEDEEKATKYPVRLRVSEDGGKDLPGALSNAVARLVLGGIQGRLPQWAVGYESGHIDFGRQYAPRRGGKVDLMPRFLFGINWADSGPGMSWPEDYYATYLPGLDLYVVTASQDSADMHGYTDEAIGKASVGLPIEDAVRPAIQGWWSMQANEWNQQQWAYVWTTGEIDTSTAEVWASNVWDAETGEPLQGGTNGGEIQWS